MGDQISMTDNDGKSNVDFKESFASSELFKSLFHEGMDLVKEAAAYLDGPGRIEAQALTRDGNLAYTKQSMLLTTRLMQMASWLLVHRAVGEGELSSEESVSRDNLVVVEAPPANRNENEAELPPGLCDLSERSLALQERIARLDKTIRSAAGSPLSGPAGLSDQLDQLTAAFSAPPAKGETEKS